MKNWGDIISLEYGKSLRGYQKTDGRFPVYGTNGPIGRHDISLCPHAGIIIGRKGAYRGVHFSTKPFFVIDTAFYVMPQEELELRWAYYNMLRMDINGMDSGSAIPSTSRETFYCLRVLVPHITVQRQFAKTLTPIWLRQIANDEEVIKLSAVRDTLIPKLISGELRVPDADKLIEEVV